MVNQKEFQKRYYETEWSNISLAKNPRETGWRTSVPSPDFLTFVKWLKKENISGTALDIGCGGGRHAIVLAGESFEVHGIDFSKSAITVAREESRKASLEKKTCFRVGDALHLPYKKNFFDVVNDDGCLHHITKDDWKKYLENVKRVLKNEGILRVKVFSKNCDFYRKNKPKRSLRHWLRIPKEDYTYFFDKKELLSLLEKDFEIQELKEKWHSVTKKKRFFFVVLRKRKRHSDLSEETKKEIAEAREDFKNGKYFTFEEVMNEAGL